MLFNSGEFIFFFLPLVLVGYYFIQSVSKKGNTALLFLALSSLFFYGWWDAKYLILISASIVVNYWTGQKIIELRRKSERIAKTALIVGITANLASLAYFKYSTFLLENIGALGEFDFHLVRIILPLAISFFTFQQIAYLVDSFRAECDDYDFIHYCLFVTFFPQLIAGPIVHHSEMMPQFLNRSKRCIFDDFYVGVSFFVFGLAKKVLLADNIAQWSSPVFAAADQGTQLGTVEAWGGALAYSLQLYFDFSGYADMAIGSARMFGIKLPINFNSPYQSISIIEFWRRWHMTLSRFLRDYLYIPLGGNKKGTLNRHKNLIITMLLGGLWHGAGWNFVIWGGLHGVYLVINHTFQRVKPKTKVIPPLLARALSCTLTLFCVIIAWVFFRAESLSGATSILHSMFVFSDALITDQWINSSDRGWKLIIGASLMVIFAPNTSKLMNYYGEAKADTVSTPLWKPNIITGTIISILFVATAIRLSSLSELLYFQF